MPHHCCISIPPVTSFDTFFKCCSTALTYCATLMASSSIFLFRSFAVGTKPVCASKVLVLTNGMRHLCRTFTTQSEQRAAQSGKMQAAGHSFPSGPEYRSKDSLPSFCSPAPSRKGNCRLQSAHPFKKDSPALAHLLRVVQEGDNFHTAVAELSLLSFLLVRSRDAYVCFMRLQECI